MSDIVTTVLVSAGTAFSTKAIEGPIQTFNDIWNGVFGHKIHYWAEKKRKEAEFEAMKNYVPKIPQTIEELDEDDLYYLEKRRYWKNFYKKHKVLHFIREWFIPRSYYFDGPDYLDKFE